jgi:hypothetical protein
MFVQYVVLCYECMYTWTFMYIYMYLGMYVCPVIETLRPTS